jgi:YD repeat-containing protein
VLGHAAGTSVGARFAEHLARQAWDRANEEWFRRHGFDASISHDNDRWWEASLQPMRAPGVTTEPSMKVFYELGNQPPYSVAMGPVLLHYRGAIVRMIQGYRVKTSEDELGGTHTFCDGSFNWIHAHSGWITDYIPNPFNMHEGDGAGIYKSAWLKGYLKRSAVRTWSDTTLDLCGRVRARYVYRYQYHAPDGTVIAFFQRPAEVSGYSDRLPCGATPVPTPEPSFYWSSEGNAALDTTNRCKPVIRWADGSTEEFHGATTTPSENVGPPFFLGAPYEPSCSAADLTADLRRVDRNGNITTYHYTANANGTFEQTMIDPQGRETTVTYDINGQQMPRLRMVQLPSIGTAPRLLYTVSWRTLEVRFDREWPDVVCTPEHGTDRGCTAPISIDVVDSIMLPDGRHYNFDYGRWGNLTRVIEPAGAVREYDYGDASNTEYAHATLSLVNRLETSQLCGDFWSNEVVKMQARGVVRERLFPDGLGPQKRVFRKDYQYELRKLPLPECSFDGLGAATTGPDGCSQVWMKTINEPDGVVTKRGIITRALRQGLQPNDTTFSVPPKAPGEVHGQSLGTETWDGTTLVAAQYNGDPDTGVMWHESDFVKIVGSLTAIPANTRATKARMLRDGLTTTTNFVHGEWIDIDPGAAEQHRATAVTEICVFGGAVDTVGCPTSAAPLLRTKLAYTHYFDGTFGGRNLLNLDAAKRVYGPRSEEPLVESIFAYDEFPVAPTGRPASALDPGLPRSARAPRGNMTRSTQRVSATKSLSTTTQYFDNGAVQSVTDPKGHAITHAPSFALCSASPRLISTTTNALNHITKTVTDCKSDLILTAIDPNGLSTYTQYDHLRRPVETAAPGDVLTALPQTGPDPYTRDPNAPTGDGSRVGQAMVSTWTEYVSLGAVGQRRVIEHLREGSPGGLYKKVFSDGLGRVVQTRAETDPSKNGGLGEIVSTTVYDEAGRVARTFAPCFAAVSDEKTEHCDTASTAAEYDAIGREVNATTPGGRITTHAYGHENERWVQTTVNPRGFITKRFTNRLDHPVQIDRQSSRCGGFCSTTMTFDEAGRLLTQSDPGENTVIYQYDDMGRRTGMTDPDMGKWSYEYDDDGNLIAQTDAKGQRIEFEYDAIHRIVRKDLPPIGTSPEDVTYFYDGKGPEPPPVTTAAPSITSLSPSSVVAGSLAFAMTVEGANFAAGSVVRFNGQDRPTTFVNATRLTAQIPGSDVQAAGSFPVTVVNPSSNGGASTAVNFIVESTILPSITAISPSSVNAGSTAFTMTVDGNDFMNGAVVRFNGQDRQTAFVSATRLTAQILGSDVQTAGTFPVSVVNPAPHGGISNNTTFTVEAAVVPSVTRFTPTSVAAGSGTFVLAIEGANFKPTATVRFNQQNPPTSVESSTRLTALIDGFMTQSAGPVSVIVTNPGPSGGSSSAVTFTIGPPIIPSITTVSPTVVEVGATNGVLTVQGTNFVSDSKIGVDGVLRATTVISPTEVRAPIASHELQQAGIRTIAVFNGSNRSNTVNVYVNAKPRVTLTSPTSQTFTTPATVPLRATVVDETPGAVVEYYSSLTLIGTSSTPPAYAVDWANPPVGQLSLKARVRDAHGSVTDSATVTIRVERPLIVPKITGLSPYSVRAGSPDFTVTIRGTDFEPGATVQFDGLMRRPSSESSTQLTVPVRTFEVQSPGTHTVTVTNPSGASAQSSVLVTDGRRYNVALAVHGAAATASSTHATHSLAAIHDGDRRGPQFGGIWADNTPDVYPDWVQFDFDGEKVIDEVALFSMQNNATTSTAEPTETMVGSQYVVTSFAVQVWTNRGWASPYAGSAPDPTVVNGNDRIWRRVSFPPITAGKVRVLINRTTDNYTQIPEIEIYGTDARFNVALARNGGVASASSVNPAHSLAAVNNGDRRGPGFGGIWADNSPNVYPDWVQIDFDSEKVIDEVDVFSLQNNASTSTVPPSEKLTGTQYVVRNFMVQVWTNGAWVTPVGGTVTDNSLIWRRVTFPEVISTRVRVTIQATPDNYTQIPEIEVWGRDRINVARPSMGSVVTASTTASVHSTDHLTDGNRIGPAVWGDASPGVYPDWIRIDFPRAQTIDGVAIFSLQDSYPNAVRPTVDMTGSRFVVQEFRVEFWAGDGWANINGGVVTGNDRVWRSLSFAPVTTDKIRILIVRTPDNYSQVAEIEAYLRSTP